MNIWWVNHKQTARQEIAGGYLWSPKKMSNGARSQYYEFMRETRPDDIVVSFANAQIGHYGIVTGFPISAPKPDEFGSAGENWSNDGWLVPVSWSAVGQAFRPKDSIELLRPFLPERYAPIQATGNGNQAAYLTKIDHSLLEELMRLGSFNPDPAAENQRIADDEAIIEGIEDKIQANIEADESLDKTEIESIVRARKGQGAFRRSVERIEPRCRVTGLEDKRLLIASHIKPWRACETAQERLDGANGLLLAPHIDRLFDIGLISFEKNGAVNVSSTLNAKTRDCLGLSRAIGEGVGAFSGAQNTYLGYHRDSVFLA
ncbi:HNH endonuclease [uncultured Roseobacter sp.]|uniref:HNH endonuclease n=1 Tax=uncultured Roseobacter sp. TaxID=114847 RepID=UPI00261CFC56|nr:HNH endonuclease [uncultured Roseobacter sp.]